METKKTPKKQALMQYDDQGCMPPEAVQGHILKLQLVGFFFQTKKLLQRCQHIQCLYHLIQWKCHWGNMNRNVC